MPGLKKQNLADTWDENKSQQKTNYIAKKLKLFHFVILHGIILIKWV